MNKHIKEIVQLAKNKKDPVYDQLIIAYELRKREDKERMEKYKLKAEERLKLLL